MTDINTRNFSEELYKDAIQKSKDGNISSKNLESLVKQAEKNGINKEERLFLEGLTSKTNIDKLKTLSDSNKPVTISFDLTTSKTESKQKVNMIESGGTFKTLEKYNNLNSNQKTKFSNLFEGFPQTERTALMELLDNGTLQKKDSKGTTVLETISEIKNGKNKSGVNGNELAKDAVLILSDRKYISQGPHGTCGAGALQNHLWSKDPAELGRIVKDLASDGECTLRDGSILKAGTGSLGFHYGDTTTNGSIEDRRDFNIIFQSSVMRDVALVGGNRALGNAYIYDLADYNVASDNGDAKSVKSGDSASNPLLLGSLVESITGLDYTTTTSFLWGKDKQMNELKKAVKLGNEPIVLINADDEMSKIGNKHYVLVNRFADNNVYYWDTATYKDGGFINSMPEDEFKSRLEGIIKQSKLY